MSVLLSLPAQTFHPITFLERGVSLPFTTPMLVGARARPAERGGLELVVPNPSGGRGVYVLPWSGVRELCRPTIHDTRLIERVAELHGVTPLAIRRVAREVAAEGLAGRQAASAARGADEAEHQAQLATNFHLLLTLVQQVEPPGSNPLPPERDTPEGIERRARLAFARLVPRLGQNAEAIASGLEQLSRVFAPIGVGRLRPQARVQSAAALLARVRGEIEEWRLTWGDEGGLAAQLVISAADVTLACLRPVLAGLQEELDDLPRLLERWREDPGAVAARAARPDWMLDGWERLCLLWQAAPGHAARCEVLAEIVQLVPILPKEVCEWMGMAVDTDAPLRYRRMVEQHRDWRTGHLIALSEQVWRNEQIVAAELA